MTGLTKWTECKSQNGYGENGIVLKGGDNRILSVVKNENGIEFMEECDCYFSETYTKEDALKVIDELREWLTCSEFINILLTKADYELLKDKLAELRDAGPEGEGWQSKELEDLQNKINKASKE